MNMWHGKVLIVPPMPTVSVLLLLLSPAAAYNLPPSRIVPLSKVRGSAARSSSSAPLADADQHCLVDEHVAECFVRNQVDGPWADVWARYVLLRPGMSYSELKRATLQRNQLDPSRRIPGTYRTVVIAHALCFAAALPAVITSDAIFPKLLVAATASRVAAGI
mmetsp:Transcript_14558/g.29488  ORF Transcript_14558/g.29488 Transcript_14558/m.29488 type:complete len:163 (+) Transcript_14558:3-491(+)